MKEILNKFHTHFRIIHGLVKINTVIRMIIVFLRVCNIMIE